MAVLLLAPDFGFRELALASTPALSRLAERGAAGMMNIRTVHAGSVDEGFLTVGAGARANVSFVGEIGQSFGRNERFEEAKGAEVYRRRTGLDPQSFQILALDYAQIRVDSALANYDLRPGLLGDSLRQAGIIAGVIGNGDQPPGIPGQVAFYHREVVGAAMDHLGRVPAGDVAPALLSTDPTSPYSVHMNSGKVLAAFDRLAPRCRFIAIEDGDLIALHASSAVYTGAAYAAEQKKALKRLDLLVDGLMQRTHIDRDLLIVAAPAIEGTPAGPINLGPIIAAGPGLHGGWLASAATRRAGLVVITDLAPTVLQFFKIAAPPSASGSPLVTVNTVRKWGAGLLWTLPVASHPIESAAFLAARIARADHERDDVQRWFVYLIQVLVLVGAAAVALGNRGKLGRWRVSEWAFLAPAAIPLAMFIEPFLGPGSSPVAAVEIAALIAALTAAGLLASDRGVSAVSLLAWLTLTAITADLLSGQQAMIFSMLSYSPSEGARYYGIGNEYMGVLLGASVCAICTAAGAERWRRVLAALGLFIPAALICHPSIGAKAGGAMVAVPTAAMGAWILLGVRVSGRTIAAVVVLGVAALAGLAAWDASGGRAMSHIGRSVQGIQSGGAPEVINIISRKSLMEWRLMKYSPWSRCALFTLIALTILYWARKPAWQTMMTDGRWRAAVWALSTAALTGLLFNDAGVLAAALSLIWLPALVVEELSTRQSHE